MLCASGLCLQAEPIRGVDHSSRENVSGPRMFQCFVCGGEKNQTLFAKLQIVADRVQIFTWLGFEFL